MRTSSSHQKGEAGAGTGTQAGRRGGRERLAEEPRYRVRNVQGVQVKGPEGAEW